MLIKFSLAAALSVLVCGCATKYVATAAPSCRALQSVTIDNDDWLTEDTASQIEANNLAREKLCGKKKRKA
jgi:hypothetical protein